MRKPFGSRFGAASRVTAGFDVGARNTPGNQFKGNPQIKSGSTSEKVGLARLCYECQSPNHMIAACPRLKRHEAGKGVAKSNACLVVDRPSTLTDSIQPMNAVVTPCR
jgi:hypothetical protein